MFYCPIHKEHDHQTYVVDSIKDNFDFDVCKHCYELLDKFLPVSTWFYDSNRKINQDLKTSIRNKPVEYYQKISIYERIGSSLKVSKYEKFTSLRYIDDMLAKVHVYETKELNAYMIAARTQRKYRMTIIQSPEIFPIMMGRDDDFVKKILALS